MANGDTPQLDTSKNDSKWGGAREGAGRPKGSENDDTKKRRMMESAMKRRIVEATDALLDSQMALAMGEVNLYRVYYTGEGKNRKKHVEVVEDRDTITDFLSDSLDYGDDDYYYIARKSPDSRSIDSLLDRTYGKAKNSIDLTSAGRPVPIVGGMSVSANDSNEEASQTTRED